MDIKLRLTRQGIDPNSPEMVTLINQYSNDPGRIEDAIGCVEHRQRQRQPWESPFLLFKMALENKWKPPLSLPS